jgi:hypothetical protein
MRIHRLQVGVANIDYLAARLVQQAIEYRALLSDTDSAKATRSLTIHAARRDDGGVPQVVCRMLFP